MARRKSSQADDTAALPVAPDVVADAPPMDAPPMDAFAAEDRAGEMAETTPAAPKPKRAVAPFLMGAAFGVVASGLGYGAALKFPIAGLASLSPAAATVDLAPVQDSIASLTAQNADLAARLASLEGAAPADTSALKAQINALEAKLAALPMGTEISAELEAIRAKLAQTDPAPAIKAAIAAEMANITASAQDMAQQVAAATDAANKLAAQNLLRAALDTGAPYTAAAASLTLPDVLAQHSETGIPSLPVLKDSFPVAARLGLEAALRDNMGETWGQRVTNFLRAQTGARALTPQSGADPDAILSRIEAALNAADLPQALAEAATLPDPAKLAMADWLAAAQLRADALAAFATLTQGEN